MNRRQGAAASLLVLLAASCGEECSCDITCDWGCSGDSRVGPPGDDAGGDLGRDSGPGPEDGSEPPGPDTLAPDTASAELGPGPDGSAPDVVPDDTGDPGGDVTEPPAGETRALWVTRWDYASPEDIDAVLQDAADWGFNTVFFQVRAVADAYYDSTVEPWAKALTGTLGADPGWDPLAVAVEAAEARGLELHAWINTFTAWSGTTPPPPSDPPHILYAHPEWRQAGTDGVPMAWNDSYTWVSPGVPGVRDRLIAVVQDIASRYAVDGIHLDYIRYAGPSFSHDPWSEDAYEVALAGSPGLTWGDFQRDLLSGFVGEVTASVAAVAPGVPVSAAVWGIHQDVFGWGGTSKGYDDYYQHSHRWTQEGLIDAICPMIYWPLTDPPGGKTDFGVLTLDHLAAAGQRHVYPGLKADYGEFGEVAAEIAFARDAGAPGVALFAYSTVSSRGYGPDLAAGPFSLPMPPAAMPWK
ncbi:MAG: family 10 glycosylhydrolase [Deltaproteobacteria bacterium]|nr:family 10 glycosylhydrolase [Deltaproteobacteria bacterium]